MHIYYYNWIVLKVTLTLYTVICRLISSNSIINSGIDGIDSSSPLVIKEIVLL